MILYGSLPIVDKKTTLLKKVENEQDLFLYDWE